MEAEVKGTKEIMELVDGLAVLAKAGFAVAADKKVDMADLQHAFALVQQSGVIMAAIEGIDQIPAEVKDLSLEEAQAVIMKLIAAIKEVKAA